MDPVSADELLGRRVLLVRADDATKRWYKEHLGLSDDEMEDVKLLPKIIMLYVESIDRVSRGWCERPLGVT